MTDSVVCVAMTDSVVCDSDSDVCMCICDSVVMKVTIYRVWHVHIAVWSATVLL